MSLPLHHHCLNSTVGEWCNWNIRFQLKDLPQDYSSYPAARLGRDGQEYDRSSWGIATSDDQERRGVLSHNSLKNWLEANKSLSYPQMQIKCLTWLLEKEKAIGCPDAESYFLNILLLEIQILKRRLECGEKVEAELAILERRQKEKLAIEIPAELLPAKP
jgi:hypothetical protein